MHDLVSMVSHRTKIMDDLIQKLVIQHKLHMAEEQKRQSFAKFVLTVRGKIVLTVFHENLNMNEVNELFRRQLVVKCK